MANIAERHGVDENQPRREPSHDQQADEHQLGTEHTQAQQADENQSGREPFCPAHDHLDGLSHTPLSFYLHIPFCAVRCGYCDFNTYTPHQLGGMSIDEYLAAAHREIAGAHASLGDAAPTISTIFCGGGTPTMATPAQLGGLVHDIAHRFGLADDAEITTEANPETIDQQGLEELLAAGFTRISLGMQSADEQVLATLDRRHTPGRALQVARWAHQAGFTDVSLDLIYGTPGESIQSWRSTLDEALSVDPEHISAYSLIVEPGTAMARRIRHGEIAAPDEDSHAEKYEIAEAMLSAAGLENYEISNWSKPGHQARHNMAYWRSHNWWGIGPGAHSHIHGVRWWNVRHPRRYASMLANNESPCEGSETLSENDRHTEKVMLELRLAEGLELSELDHDEIARLAHYRERGMVTVTNERVILTPRGRLLADAITRDLLD